MLDRGLGLDDQDQAGDIAEGLEVGGLDEERLRGREMGEAASVVASHPKVRKALLDLQRRFAHQKGGAVLDGRDIGTVIAPGADAKIFVTAAAEVRARRRHLELVGARRRHPPSRTCSRTSGDATRAMPAGLTRRSSPRTTRSSSTPPPWTSRGPSRRRSRSSLAARRRHSTLDFGGRGADMRSDRGWPTDPSMTKQTKPTTDKPAQMDAQASASASAESSSGGSGGRSSSSSSSPANDNASETIARLETEKAELKDRLLAHARRYREHAPTHRARGRRRSQLRDHAIRRRHARRRRQHGASARGDPAGCAGRTDTTLKAVVEGAELTEREMLRALEKHGVKVIDPKGEKFDPHFHQAMFEIPDPSVPSGTVAQVMQVGYSIGERVLRPAMVGVARGGPKAAAGGEAGASVDKSA